MGRAWPVCPWVGCPAVAFSKPESHWQCDCTLCTTFWLSQAVRRDCRFASACQAPRVSWNWRFAFGFLASSEHPPWWDVGAPFWPPVLPIVAPQSPSITLASAFLFPWSIWPSPSYLTFVFLSIGRSARLSPHSSPASLSTPSASASRTSSARPSVYLSSTIASTLFLSRHAPTLPYACASGKRHVQHPYWSSDSGFPSGAEPSRDAQWLCSQRTQACESSPTCFFHFPFPRFNRSNSEALAMSTWFVAHHASRLFPF